MNDFSDDSALLGRRDILDLLAGGGLAALAASLPGKAFGALRKPDD